MKEGRRKLRRPQSGIGSKKKQKKLNIPVIKKLSAQKTIKKKGATAIAKGAAARVRKPRATALLRDRFVRELLTEIAGERALKIARGLGSPVTDEQLASFCKIKISDVRATLNKLHSQGLATYRRTKDKESGWYSYIWNLTLENAPKMLASRKCGEETTIGGLGFDSGIDYYTCQNHAELRIPFEVAFENKFRCSECGSQLSFVEKSVQAKEQKR